MDNCDFTRLFWTIQFFNWIFDPDEIGQKWNSVIWFKSNSKLRHDSNQFRFQKFIVSFWHLTRINIYTWFESHGIWFESHGIWFESPFAWTQSTWCFSKNCYFSYSTLFAHLIQIIFFLHSNLTNFFNHFVCLISSTYKTFLSSSVT